MGLIVCHNGHGESIMQPTCAHIAKAFARDAPLATAAAALDVFGNSVIVCNDCLLTIANEFAGKVHEWGMERNAETMPMCYDCADEYIIKRTGKSLVDLGEIARSARG